MRDPRISEICRLYREVDRKTAALRMASGLRCPSGCGRCCATSKVEASILEVLPAAEGLYLRNETDAVMAMIEEKNRRGDRVCVFHMAHEDPFSQGCCAHYLDRPLICRLFGFAARAGKSGTLEFRPCKWISDTHPETAAGASDLISRGFDLPVYQTSFMQVASIDPSLGFQSLPINVALRRAIEYLYWKRPLPKKNKTAA
ncbi:MAG: YkgJ family cysteine cluster protein [Desulfobacteraceae bacterium]|nr:MAG: YkgJ family cysteine cluster protein [Desulfobacteraceae bacterium]